MRTIIYVFDDINYMSGARNVMEFQMQLLSEEFAIAAFSLTKPTESSRQRLHGIKIEGSHIWKRTNSYAESFTHVWASNTYSTIEKWHRLSYTIGRRVKKQGQFLPRSLNQVIATILEPYDVVCVVSEASALRNIVSNLHHPKKIQWIHTDYAMWSSYSDWTKKITANDGELYCKYDNIVTLSQTNRDGLLKSFPILREKTKVIPNVIPVAEILKKSLVPFDKNPCTFVKETMNIITVGRVDHEKAYDRILDLCQRLKKETIAFRWHIVGDGPLLPHLQKRVKQDGLSNDVILYGEISNPYPLIKSCDLFALLSLYEGTPITIPEALILGIPVVATDVGGIAEQLAYGKYGIVIENKVESIYQTIKELLFDVKALENLKKRVAEYCYCNDEIVEDLKKMIKFQN